MAHESPDEIPTIYKYPEAYDQHLRKLKESASKKGLLQSMSQKAMTGLRSGIMKLNSVITKEPVVDYRNFNFDSPDLQKLLEGNEE